MWLFTWEWCGHAAELLMTNECWAWLVAFLRSVPGVRSRPGYMKNSVWPWDRQLKPELPLQLTMSGTWKSLKLLPSTSVFSLLLSPCSSRHNVKKKVPSSSIFSSHFHHMLIQNLWSLDTERLPCVWACECKHEQRGCKNKSVIARDSLCQHLSWWAP